MNRQKVFRVCLIFLVFFVLFLYYFHPVNITMGDLGYYLKTGEIIVKTLHVPDANLFSYTHPDYPFINPNWLSEVIFYLCQSIAGFSGLTTLSVLLATAAFGLVFIQALKKQDIVAVGMVSFIYLQILFERTDIKPELFSYVLLSLFLLVLNIYRKRQTKWIFVLIPLEILWANMHLYFFIGLAVIFLYLVNAAINEKRHLHAKTTIILAVVFCLSCLGTLINPSGWKGAIYPMTFMNNYGFAVEENINFFTAINAYSDPTFIFFGSSMVLLWAGIIFFRKKFERIDIMLALLFSLIAIFAVRAFPLFVFGTFLSVVKVVDYGLQWFMKKLQTESRSYYRYGLLLTVLLLITPTVAANTAIKGVGAGVIDPAAGVTDFLKTNNITGRIYNNYDIGSYLEYQLYPQQVFADARPEAYPAEFFSGIYLPMQESLRTFNSYSQKYNFSVIVFSHVDSSVSAGMLLNNLAKSAYWKMVYLNSYAVIFVRNIPQYTQLIRQFAVNENKIAISFQERNDLQSTRRLVNFFRTLGWENAWLEMDLRYLDFEPDNCQAVQNAAYLLQKQKNPQANFYLDKYIKNCL